MISVGSAWNHGRNTVLRLAVTSGATAMKLSARWKNSKIYWRRRWTFPAVSLSVMWQLQAVTQGHVSGRPQFDFVCHLCDSLVGRCCRRVPLYTSKSEHLNERNNVERCLWCIILSWRNCILIVLFMLFTSFTLRVGIFLHYIFRWFACRSSKWAHHRLCWLTPTKTNLDHSWTIRYMNIVRGNWGDSDAWASCGKPKGIRCGTVLPRSWLGD